MRLFTCLFISVFIFSFPSSAQFVINGPTCVTTQTAYQYTVMGSIDSSTSTQICITGGRFLNSSENCIGLDLSQIQVIWDTDATEGKLSISYSTAVDSLNVAITPALSGGSIDSSNSSQIVEMDSIPTIINCSAATGGSCEPLYEYQWQQSENALVWEDIENAKGQNLTFYEPVHTPLFYRRRVTETVSTMIKYSNLYAIYLRVP